MIWGVGAVVVRGGMVVIGTGPGVGVGVAIPLPTGDMVHGFWVPVRPPVPMPVTPPGL